LNYKALARYGQRAERPLALASHHGDAAGG
jgi:hypothetical protein